MFDLIVKFAHRVWRRNVFFLCDLGYTSASCFKNDTQQNRCNRRRSVYNCWDKWTLLFPPFQIGCGIFLFLSLQIKWLSLSPSLFLGGTLKAMCEKSDNKDLFSSLSCSPGWWYCRQHHHQRCQIFLDGWIPKDTSSTWEKNSEKGHEGFYVSKWFFLSFIRVWPQIIPFGNTASAAVVSINMMPLARGGGGGGKKGATLLIVLRRKFPLGQGLLTRRDWTLTNLWKLTGKNKHSRLYSDSFSSQQSLLLCSQ